MHESCVRVFFVVLDLKCGHRVSVCSFYSRPAVRSRYALETRKSSRCDRTGG